jgi:ribosomal-protein-alanine N-acetyltransferase
VQVQNLAVHPAFRRRGVGRFLLAEGLREAHRRGARLATLEVRPSNLAARRLYASLGFVETGRRPGYYQAEGEDALLLDCRLEEAAWLRTGTGKALDHRRRSN